MITGHFLLDFFIGLAIAVPSGVASYAGLMWLAKRYGRPWDGTA